MRDTSVCPTHPQTRCDTDPPALPELSVDLVAASWRSDDFPAELGPEARAESALRYRKWLALKQRFPELRMAPTRDIDAFWHLHMLSPVAYQRDCARLFGRTLDHDGGFGKGPGEAEVLRRVFTRTEQLWEATWREPYRLDPVARPDAQPTDCWHDCQDRCWHACAELS
jgi:hypothetical protein